MLSRLVFLRPFPPSKMTWSCYPPLLASEFLSLNFFPNHNWIVSNPTARKSDISGEQSCPQRFKNFIFSRVVAWYHRAPNVHKKIKTWLALRRGEGIGFPTLPIPWGAQGNRSTRSLGRVQKLSFSIVTFCVSMLLVVTWRIVTHLFCQRRDREEPEVVETVPLQVCRQTRKRFLLDQRETRSSSGSKDGTRRLGVETRRETSRLDDRG